MSQHLITLLSALAFVVVLGSSSLFAVRHELSEHRAAHRRALARVRVTAPRPVRG